MKYKAIKVLDEVKEYLEGQAVVAFDFETAPKEKFRNEEKAALDPRKGRIVGISFSVSRGTGIYIPLSHFINNALFSKQMIMWLKDNIFMNGEVIKVAHNLSFEAMFLYSLGILIQPPYYDTIAAAQMTLKSSVEFRKLSDSGLKKLVPELFHKELPTFEEVTQGKYFDELDPLDNKTIKYACSDSDYALRLYYLFNNWFDNYLPKHRYIVEEIESGTAVYIGLMKYNGVLVDENLMRKKQQEAEAKIMQIKDKIDNITGGIPLGENANTKVFKEYLFKELCLPVLKTTEKGSEALDDEALILLREYSNQHYPALTQLFDMILEFRKWSKIKSTYIDGYAKYINHATNRIHCDFYPLATQTGRFVSRNPNLQNCPRKGNDPIGVRNFIKASKGNVLLSLDFSQIELRVGAFYCKDEKMIKTYKGNGDIHALTTALIYHISMDEAEDKSNPKYKERRTIAKNCNFGTFYGLYPKGLKRTLNIKAGLDTDLNECERIIQSLKAGYSRLTKWQESAINEAKRTGYTETFLGRRRYLPNINSEDFKRRSFAERCALNTPIQGTAADILKLAINRILQGLNERDYIKPLLQIHDELVFEVAKDKADEAIAFIKLCMETPPFGEFDIPLIAEVSQGDTFGSLD